MGDNLRRKCFKCGLSPRDDPNIKLYRFPKPGSTNIRRCETWAQFCLPNREWSSAHFQRKLHMEHRMLCNKHFTDIQYIDIAEKKLSKNGVPDAHIDKLSDKQRYVVINIPNNTRNECRVIAEPSSSRISTENKQHIMVEMNSDFIEKVSVLRSKIKSFPNFPKDGILFWDIFSALSDGSTCKLIQNLLVEVIRTKYPDVEAVVGLEARGFLFSFSVAAELGIACLPVRKKGKLPGNVISYKYELEYGSDVLEIQKDTVRPGLKCIIIDDLIATGGSIAAAAELLRSCGAHVIGSVVIIELLQLNGRENIPEGFSLQSLITYE